MLCHDFRSRYDGIPLAVYERVYSGEFASHGFVHNHSEIEMLYAKTGSAAVHIGHRIHTIRCGEVAVISPYETHSVHYKVGMPCRLCCICFDSRLLSDEGLAVSLEDGQRTVTPILSTEAAASTVGRLYALCMEKPEAWRTEARGRLLLLGAELVRSGDITETESAGKQGLFGKRVLEYLNTHIGESITSADAAAAFYISRGHFARLFGAEFGMPFSAYLCRFRLERARTLLHETEEPIIRVAQAVGFDSPSYFTRHFREAYGLTPREFRRQGRD